MKKGLIVLSSLALLLGIPAYGLEIGSFTPPVTEPDPVGMVAASGATAIIIPQELITAFPGSMLIGAVAGAVCVGILVQGLDLTGVDFTGIKVDPAKGVVEIDSSKMPTGLDMKKLTTHLKSGSEFLKAMSAWKAEPDTEVMLAKDGSPVTKGSDKFYKINEDGSRGDEVPAEEVTTYKFADVQKVIDQLEQSYAAFEGATAPRRKQEIASKIAKNVELLNNLADAF